MGSQVTGYPQSVSGTLKHTQKQDERNQEDTKVCHIDFNKAKLFTKQQFVKNSAKGIVEKFLSEQRMANED